VGGAVLLAPLAPAELSPGAGGTGRGRRPHGDGYTDVVVGAHLYDNGQTDEGRALVYYGNGGDGLDLTPRQMRTDGSVPVVPLSKSDSATGVHLRLTGRSPLGREQVKLEWQVAPLGTPFPATNILSGTSAA
jgi:hypothetical protein